jgi:endonuclease YncB( thermonuclease family)
MPTPVVSIALEAVGHDAVKREILALQQAAGPSGAAQQRLAQSTAQAKRAAAQQTATIARAERGLRSLESSLGGAFRAESQLAVAEQRLDAAVRAGLVSTERELALRRQMLNREMVRQGWALAWYPERGAVPGPGLRRRAARG